MIDSLLVIVLFLIGIIIRLGVIPFNILFTKDTCCSAWITETPYHYVAYAYIAFFLKFVFGIYISSFTSIFVYFMYDISVQILDLMAYSYFYRREGTVLGKRMGSFMVCREFMSFFIRMGALLFTGLRYYPLILWSTWAHRYVDTYVKYYLYDRRSAYSNVISQAILGLILFLYSAYGSTYIGCALTMYYAYHLASTSRVLHLKSWMNSHCKCKGNHKVGCKCACHACDCNACLSCKKCSCKPYNDCDSCDDECASCDEPPSTTASPMTTVAPTTTVSPMTTASPMTTVAPTTTVSPKTTMTP
jgi:hypothetical protein